MSRPIERTLTNLIPRHSGTLPRELIDLADSLLSQSRNKCFLKPDEEIARVYACANLACERLKTILNLPQIESHPPIPPRAYTKLYAYFDRTLQTSAARAKAQRSARSTPSKPLPQRGTPNKEQSFKSFSTSTPSHRTPKRGLKHASKPEKESKIPRWIESVTRHLCKSMDTPKAYPHILAGVETLLSSPCPTPEIEAMVSEEKGNRNVPALIASIWFLVVVRMREKDRRGFETSARQKMARDVIAGAREDEWVVKRVGEGEEGWKGWEGLVVGDVMGWNREVNGRGWKGLDWWLNVPEGSGVEGEMADVDVDQELEREEEDEIVVGGRERKPDTMYQAKYDYLSVDKRAEYREWKEEMLAMMQELRGQNEDTAMADA